MKPPPAPTAAPELFTKQDFEWLERSLKKTLVELHKCAPDSAFADALIAAMVTVSIGVSTRALKKYFAELQPRFSDIHAQNCGAFAMISSDRTQMAGLKYRIEILERALIAAGKK